MRWYGEKKKRNTGQVSYDSVPFLAHVMQSGTACVWGVEDPFAVLVLSGSRVRESLFMNILAHTGCRAQPFTNGLIAHVD